MQAVILDLTGCARCGEAHERIGFQPLQNPVQIGGVTLTHWAPCPTNGEPIILQTMDELGSLLPGGEAVSAYEPPEVLAEAGLAPQAALEAFGWKGQHDVEEEEESVDDRAPCPTCGQRICFYGNGKLYRHKTTDAVGHLGEWCPGGSVRVLDVAPTT